MSKKIFRAFVDGINRQDVSILKDLMSDNHEFIDSVGNHFFGRDSMASAWEDYFSCFPDYKINIQEIFPNKNTFMAYGRVSGTFSGGGDGTQTKKNQWTIPAAWRAVIEDGKIVVWQVFADTKIVYDIINH